MTKKLYELISKSYGSKVVLFGEELTLDRVTVAKLIELETQGEDIQSLMSNFTTQPATVSTKLGWLLLNDEAKAAFDNKYSNFINSLEMSDLEILGNAVVEAVNNSRPPESAEKNEIGSKD